MARLYIAPVLGALIMLTDTVRAQVLPPVFAPVITYPTGMASVPTAVRISDVNGDERPDIITANYGNNTVGVLLGNGDGTFGLITTYSIGGGSLIAGLAVSDVSGDGKPDLLVANPTNNTAGVLLGTGGGTFKGIVTYAAGYGAASLTAADVTGDGKPDLLVAAMYAGSVGILPGNGNGTFQAPVFYTTGSSSAPYEVEVADVNGDNLPDLLTANHYSNTAGVLLGTGVGMFGPVATYSLGASNSPVNITVADVSNDGKPDLLLTCSGTCLVEVLLGTGTGAFKTAHPYSICTGNSANGCEVADINGDGQQDILVANSSNNGIGILLGNGNGTFQAVLHYATGLASLPNDLAVADLNNDGRPDVITSNSGSNTVGILLSANPLPTRAALPGTTATLAPNPATSATTLALAGLPATVSRVEATVFDPTGREVARHSLAAAQGTVRAELATAGLAHGLYVVRLLALNARGEAASMLAAQRLSVE